MKYLLCYLKKKGKRSLESNSEMSIWCQRSLRHSSVNLVSLSLLFCWRWELPVRESLSIHTTSSIPHWLVFPGVISVLRVTHGPLDRFSVVATWLMLGLHPNKPSVSRQYPKSKVHLISYPNKPIIKVKSHKSSHLKFRCPLINDGLTFWCTPH